MTCRTAISKVRLAILLVVWVACFLALTEVESFYSAIVTFAAMLIVLGVIQYVVRGRKAVPPSGAP